MATRPIRYVAATVLLAAAVAAQMAARAAPTLDYDFFKARVEPIFLQKRDGHTRCYVCHAESNNAFRLERLSPGASTLERGAVAAQFRDGIDPGEPGRSRDQPPAAAAARTRGRRQCLPLRRTAVCVEGGRELENPGRLGERPEAIDRAARQRSPPFAPHRITAVPAMPERMSAPLPPPGSTSGEMDGIDPRSAATPCAPPIRSRHPGFRETARRRRPATRSARHRDRAGGCRSARRASARASVFPPD